MSAYEGTSPPTRTIALGSGNGGCGRTTIALELAWALGRRGISTVVVDCSLLSPMVADALDRGGARVKLQVSMSAPGAKLEDYVQREEGSQRAVLTLADAVDNPRRLFTTPPERFLDRLKALGDRFIILDLPVGAQPFWSELWTQSDIPLVLSGPESWSVRATLSFLEACYSQAKRRSRRSFLRSYLVLNRCRDASERELGEVLCHAIWRKLGTYPRYLGPVDHDERRWFHHRHSLSCPPLSGAAGLGVQIEELAGSILHLDSFNEDRPRSEMGTEFEGSKAAWIGMSDVAPALAMRQQYRRLWEGYRRDSAVSRVVFDSETRISLIAELERTYRTLQVAHERASSAENSEDLVPVGGEGGESANEAQTREEIEIVDANCGGFIERKRKAAGLSRRDLSQRTKVGLRYIEAIEQLERAALPRAVYLRGYLREIARALDLPVDSLLERYLTELTGVR